MMRLGISLESDLNTLEKYSRKSRLRLTHNIQAKNALPAERLSRKVYPREPIFVDVGVSWIEITMQPETSLVEDWVR